VSYICVTDHAACIEADGDLVPLLPGTATIHAFLGDTHTEAVVSVVEPQL
jgi:hypothetical protein